MLSTPAWYSEPEPVSVYIFLLIQTQKNKSISLKVDFNRDFIGGSNAGAGIRTYDLLTAN